MMPPRTRFDEPRWLQCILQLTRIVIIEQRRRLVCIPDRMSAENERDKLQRQHGPAMSDAKISKNGKGKDATWTVSYTLRESRTEELF
jgi:hypothetical protein